MKRFWDKVARAGDDECWEWTGARKPKGYGNFWFRERTDVAHRVAYILVVGEIPTGLTIDHLCRNRGCVNPAHMEVVTMGENVRRSPYIAANIAKTHCPRGHAYDEANTYAYKSGRQCRTCVAARHRAKREATRELVTA